MYFERVLGSMDAIPLASSSVDYVYCCEVLHHNDPGGLRRTFAEIFRVLRPGGRLLMVNETLKTLRDPHGVHVEDVEQFEGYEHAHWAWRYRWEATRAGFYTEVIEPHYRPFFGDARAPGDQPQGGQRRARARIADGSSATVARAPRVSAVAEPRLGRGVDEHGRHEALARYVVRHRAGRADAPRGQHVGGRSVDAARPRAEARHRAPPPRTPEQADRQAAAFRATLQQSDEAADDAGARDPVPPR